MTESILTPEGKKPVTRAGIKTTDYPKSVWEYRIIHHVGEYQIAQFCCDCGKVINILMDSKGKNSIGSKPCHHCWAKAFACIDGVWLEVG